jgi:parallel beta-helix repeat protein
MKTRMFFSLLIAALLVLAGWEAQAQGIVKKVDCTKGQTITDALQKFDAKPITIEVKGTCNENVTIDRDDVTLIAHPSGGAISGVEPFDATIIVNGDRTVIDGLTVTGGGGGIRVLGNYNTIRNCSVQGVGANGIPFPGGKGAVDNCIIQNSGMNGIYVTRDGGVTVTNSTIQGSRYNGIFVEGRGGLEVNNSTIQNNGNHGVAIVGLGNAFVNNTMVQNNEFKGVYVEGGTATVTNNTISFNTSEGIAVVRGGSARIGVNPQYAGNTISDNGSNGIAVAFSASAYIGGNIITANGTDPNSPYGRDGIGIHQATAVLVGNNKVTGNNGSGVVATQNSSVLIGMLGFGPPPGLPIIGDFANLISGNANGVIGHQGASLNIRDAIINDNNGDGISLDFHSAAIMFGSTVNNNERNGILLLRGGGLRLQNPPVTVTGNAFFGLQCIGGESSYEGNTGGISGNTGGDVSLSCTGF